jgi:hypothetical protein
MCTSLKSLVLSVAAAAVVAAVADADVVVRGPFGGLIVVKSPSDVAVGPGGVLVTPVPVPPPVVVQPIPAAPMLPQDFAKSFAPMPGHYHVTFVHPRNNQMVTVDFDLPQGTPRVSYVPHSLYFDYGRHEVEIRFQIGGRAKVFEK